MGFIGRGNMVVWFDVRKLKSLWGLTMSFWDRVVIWGEWGWICGEEYWIGDGLCSWDCRKGGDVLDVVEATCGEVWLWEDVGGEFEGEGVFWGGEV